jgi:hypothetical protein
MVTHNLKVCISTLPRSGKSIEGELCIKAFNKLLNRSDILFTQAPCIVGVLEHKLNGALLRANITADYEQQCGVCSVFQHRRTKVPINIKFQPRPNEHVTNGNYIDDDIDISYYDNDIIDIESLAEEFLIISLDLWWKCECSTEQNST